MFFYVEERPVIGSDSPIEYYMIRSTIPTVTLDEITELAERYPGTIYFEAELVVDALQGRLYGMGLYYSKLDPDKED